MTLARLQLLLKRPSSMEELEEEETNALLPQGDPSDKKKKSFKKQKAGKNTIRKALLSGAGEYGSQLVEQVICASGVNGDSLVGDVPNTGTSNKFLSNVDHSPVLVALLEQFFHADNIVKSCESLSIKSSITAHPSKDASSAEPVYEDFMPFSPTHLPLEIVLLKYDSVLVTSLF